MSNFHPLEVVGRDSETQLQVGEKTFMWRFKGKIPLIDNTAWTVRCAYFTIL